MNKYIRFSFFSMIFPLLTACQSKSDVKSIPQQNDTTAVQSVKAPSRQEAPNYSTAIKGKVESVREVPVYSRISEQITMFAIDNVGQKVRKGQVVARLSDAALRVKIAHSRAKLEKAEFQYQAILMGQGYKHDNLDAAPENIKKMARISSGYNEASTSYTNWNMNCPIVPLPPPFLDMSSKFKTHSMVWPSRVNRSSTL